MKNGQEEFTQLLKLRNKLYRNVFKTWYWFTTQKMMYLMWSNRQLCVSCFKGNYFDMVLWLRSKNPLIIITSSDIPTWKTLLHSYGYALHETKLPLVSSYKKFENTQFKTNPFISIFIPNQFVKHQGGLATHLAALTKLLNRFRSFLKKKLRIALPISSQISLKLSLTK